MALSSGLAEVRAEQHRPDRSALVPYWAQERVVVVAAVAIHQATRELGVMVGPAEDRSGPQPWLVVQEEPQARPVLTREMARMAVTPSPTN